jgi:hypothetical protein
MPIAFDMPVKEYYRLRDEEKLTHPEIAKSVFVSPATLSRWKKRKGITDFRSPGEYIRLRKEGYRDHNICAKWDITPSALYQWKVAHDIPKEYFGHKGRTGNNGNGWQRWA